jgi:uncharacterized integral membrane protein
MLILGIVFAIGAVLFALQNNVAVAVTLAVWQFEGSLALVLIIALGLGALIMGLLSSPAVIRTQWTSARLRHQITGLEKTVAEKDLINHDLEVELARLAPVGDQVEPEEKSYVGFRALLTGAEIRK